VLGDNEADGESDGDAEAEVILSVDILTIAVPVL